jgi:hypothetical protein
MIMINRVTDSIPKLGAARLPKGATIGHTNGPVERLKRFAGPIEGFIEKYPGSALAAAFGIGVLFAWWVKRR